MFNNALPTRLGPRNREETWRIRQVMARARATGAAAAACSRASSPTAGGACCLDQEEILSWRQTGNPRLLCVRRSYSTAHSRRQHYRRHHRAQWATMRAMKGSASPSTRYGTRAAHVRCSWHCLHDAFSLRSNPNSGPGSPYTKGRGRSEGGGSSPNAKPDAPNGVYQHYLPYPPPPPGTAVYPHDPHALPQVIHPAAATPVSSAAPMPTNLPAAPKVKDWPASTGSTEVPASGSDEAPAMTAEVADTPVVDALANAELSKTEPQADSSMTAAV